MQAKCMRTHSHTFFGFFPVLVEIDIMTYKIGKRYGGYSMENILSVLDSNIQYVKHEFIDDQIVFQAKTKYIKAICPYCMMESDKVHSKYYRVFQDLPVSNFETLIHLELPKFFCINASCSYTTFSMPLPYIEPKARKTKRLQKEILALSLEMSSINSAKRLHQQKIKISKSTICRWIKKKKS
ncbi:hypothetical protein CSW12_23975 [Bacillus cereus]|nr:hypothetical protein CSW12_23975 [Bacillus cereus]